MLFRSLPRSPSEIHLKLSSSTRRRARLSCSGFRRTGKGNRTVKSNLEIKFVSKLDQELFGSSPTRMTNSWAILLSTTEHLRQSFQKTSGNAIVSLRQMVLTCVMLMNSKTKTIADRIRRLEEAIAKGREYLEFGAHAKWHGFRPWFAVKLRDGQTLPPHKEWVKNVFLPRRERALRDAQKLLEELSNRKRDQCSVADRSDGSVSS